MTTNKCLSLARLVLPLITFFRLASLNAQNISLSDKSVAYVNTAGTPNTSYDLNDLVRMNYSTGRVSIYLPLAQAGARGDARSTISLELNTVFSVRKQFGPSKFCNDAAPCWVWSPDTPNPYFEVYADSQAVKMSPGWLDLKTGDTTNGANVFTQSKFTFYKSDGSAVELVDDIYYGQPVLAYGCLAYINYHAQQGCAGRAQRGSNFTSTDGSHIRFIADNPVNDVISQFTHHDKALASGVMMLSNGTRYRISQGLVTSITDRNGNTLQVSPTSLVDSLGRSYQASRTQPDESHATEVVSVPGYAGATRTITLNFTPFSQTLASGYTALTPRQLFPSLNGTDTFFTDGTGLANITVPDGSKYQFFHNSYGEIARVVLPTGGAYEFTWTGRFGSDSSGANVSSLRVTRGVAEMREYATGGGLVRRQTISPVNDTTNNRITTTVLRF